MSDTPSTVTRLKTPISWAWTTVGELGDVVTGSTPSTNRSEYYGGPVPFLKPTDLNAGYHVRDSGNSLTKAGAEQARMLPALSILVTCIGATIGKTGLARMRCTTNQQINAHVVNSNHVRPEWIYWLFCSSWGQGQIKDNASATTLPILNKSRFSSLPLPIAPFNEQTRIVDAIEEQFTRLDAGVAALKRVEANLKRYKATVLKAACEGKLTEQWRKKNPDVEPATELLKCILEERRRKWEEAELAKMLAKGKPPKDDKWKEKYQEPTEPNLSELPRLPKTWRWVTAEQVCEYITKGTTPRQSEMSSRNADVPFVKVYNLTHEGTLNFSINPTFISTKTHRTGPLRRSTTYPGDVLMNLVGPPLGKVSIVPDSHQEWNVNQAIAILRPICGLGNRYLSICLLTEQVLAWAIQRSRATAGQRNLTLELTRHLPLPLPPASEQEEIIQDVDARMSIIQETHQTASTSRQKASRLRQSILKRAFEGKLVEQDPDDEPADILLDRIRAEREKQLAKTNSKPKHGKRASTNRKTAGKKKLTARQE